MTSAFIYTPNWSSQRAYAYDAGSEVTQQVFTVKGVSHTLDYAYDAIGQLQAARACASPSGPASSRARPRVSR